jgi:hypothetical protein
MMAAFSSLSIPSQVRADQPATAARVSGAHQGASGGVSSEWVARAQPPMANTYGAREPSSKDLANFKGGDHVVIAGSTVAIVLLVVLVVVLL